MPNYDDFEPSYSPQYPTGDGSQEMATLSQPSSLAKSGATALTTVDGIITAQRVALPRNISMVRQRIKACAERAGGRYKYRMEFKRKGGGKQVVEGPTIKCAMDVAREFGNIQIKTDVKELGDSWVFTARFVDLETGVLIERDFRQRMKQNIGGGMDAERQLDVIFQIGQSKAIRNIVVNVLHELCDFAVGEAERGMLAAINADLENYRTRALSGLAKRNIPLDDVQFTLTKKADKWTAEDVLEVIQRCRAIDDQMATSAEMFGKGADVRAAEGSGAPQMHDAGAQPEKKKETRGRKKGSKNKPKTTEAAKESTKSAEPSTDQPKAETDLEKYASWATAICRELRKYPHKCDEIMESEADMIEACESLYPECTQMIRDQYDNVLEANRIQEQNVEREKSQAEREQEHSEKTGKFDDSFGV